MAIVDKIKSDIKFRNKVIAGAVVFVLAMALGIAGVLAMNGEQDTPEGNGSEDIKKEMITGVVPTDTTRVVSEKNVLYNQMDYFQEEDNKDIVVVADEKKVGKTKEEIEQMERQEDDEIASYMKHRRESMRSTSKPNSSAAQTSSYEASSYTPPSAGTSRRKYNPYASSEDWTTTSGLSDGLDSYKTGREKQQIQQQEPPKKSSVRRQKATSFDDLPQNEQRRILLETGRSYYEETEEFSAMIMSSGMVRSGQTIILITKEDAYLNFEKVPKGTTIAGTVSFSDNRLQVNFSTIRLKNNKIVKVNLTLYGLDGLEGLPVGANLDNKDINDTGFDEATSDNITGTRIERIGKGLLKNSRQRREVKVDLGRDIMCILVNNNVK
jgi:hypothetical protein